MISFKPSLLIGAITFAAAGLAANPAQATQDWKTIAPTTCIPYAPAGTTLNNLTVNSTGIYNPGTINESVICPMPRDAEDIYSATPGASVVYSVYYRVSGGSGRLVCTLYSGSSALEAVPVYTTTVSGPLTGSGGRTFLSLNGGSTATSGYIGQPVNILCSISPKTTLAVIYQRELITTNTP